MKKFYVVICALLALALGNVGIAEELDSMKIATTPAHRLKSKHWNARYNEKKTLAEQPGAAEKYKILFVGDSITHFWETKGKEVWDRDFAANTFDVGISGDRTQHTLWLLREGGIVEHLNPQLVVVMIGTNNIGGKNKVSHPAEDIIAGITLIINELRAKCPNAKIVLFAIFPRGKQGLADPKYERISKVNEEIQKLADNQTVFFESINDQLVKKDGTISRKVMPDFLHPITPGYEIWSKAIMKYVKLYVR